MKSLSAACFEMLSKDVEKYVMQYNAWDFETRIKHTPEDEEQNVIATAIYVMGWRYNSEECIYEREENNA